MPDDTGFEVAPARYIKDGREVCDLMRDSCAEFGEMNGVEGDILFAAACLTHMIKYNHRVKDPVTDTDKARWWREMYLHVLNTENPDPRHNRPDFVPYSRVITDSVPLPGFEAFFNIAKKD